MKKYPVWKIISALMVAALCAGIISGCGNKDVNLTTIQTEPANDQVAQKTAETAASSEPEQTAPDTSDPSESTPDTSEPSKTTPNAADSNETAPEGRSEAEIVYEMALNYVASDDTLPDDTNDLIDEIRRNDPQRAEKWNRIMQTWEEVEGGTEVNYDILPDGLPSGDELCMIVLGYQLYPDGSMQDELIERLDIARRSAQKYPKALIVCTGGGSASLNEDATEAGEMADWLIENGIDSERVIAEENSITTAQNAMYTIDILKEDHPEVTSLALITSDYHLPTATLVFTAASLLRCEKPITVISNAACDFGYEDLTKLFRAGCIMELAGDKKAAFEMYFPGYEAEEIPEFFK